MFSLVRSASILLTEHPLRRLEGKTHTLEGKSHHRCISKVLLKPQHGQLRDRDVAPNTKRLVATRPFVGTEPCTSNMPLSWESQRLLCPYDRWLVWPGQFPGFPQYMTNPQIVGLA
jgi:hypothetical protein